MSRKKKLVLIIGGGVVVALGVGGALSTRNKGIIRVIAAPVTEQDIVAKVTATGKIQAENRVELSALVQGQIINLRAKEGDRVKKGDFLLQIDPNRAAADEAGSAAALRASEKDKDSAKTAMDQAQLDFDRARSNYQARIASEADYQKAQSTLEAARSAYAAAQQRVEQTRAGLTANRDTLSKTTVLAPIDGIVTTLRVKAGEVTVIGTMNNAGTQLMTISDMAIVQAVLMVDETDTPSVQVGQKALLTIDSYPGKTFDGIVMEVGNSPILKDDADLAGLTTTSDAINFKVKVNLARPPPGIRPGFSVTADIITGSKSKVAVVPLAAVVVRDSPTGEKTEAGKLKTEDGVYAIKDGKVSFVPIKTGLTGELMVEVEGIKPGQEIVTGPFKALRQVKHGDRVKVMSEKEKKAAEAQGPGPG